MSEKTEDKTVPMPEPEAEPKQPETREIVIDGPVSLEFAEQLTQVFQLRLPGNQDTDREIFRNAGQQEVVMLVTHAAQAQAKARLKGDEA